MQKDLRSLKSKTETSKEAPEAEFKNFISSLRTEISAIMTQTSYPNLHEQFESILQYRTVTELEPFKQFFIRFFAPSHYGQLGLNWSRRGKYIFDLDQLQLKLSGALYKLEKTSEV